MQPPPSLIHFFGADCPMTSSATFSFSTRIANPLSSPLNLGKTGSNWSSSFGALQACGAPVRAIVLPPRDHLSLISSTGHWKILIYEPDGFAKTSMIPPGRSVLCTCPFIADLIRMRPIQTPGHHEYVFILPSRIIEGFHATEHLTPRRNRLRRHPSQVRTSFKNQLTIKYCLGQMMSIRYNEIDLIMVIC